MANQQHLDLLQQGVKIWNKWRREHPDVRPNLYSANLRGADLSGVNLSYAELSLAHLEDINLDRAFILDAKLYSANLANANLVHALLSSTDLKNATLINANLSGADLRDTNLSSANLEKANLNGSRLEGAHLNHTYLSGADFNGAYLGWTGLVGLDFRTVQGLETVCHQGPSSIGVDTIYQSKGQVPEVFLRGAGVPNSFSTYAHSLVGQPLDFYSCFISYSSRDQSFVERLHADMQSRGVRCWFAPEDLKIGAKIRPSIDESIQLYDKLLLVLSQHSVTSQWVEQEVETALEKERKEKRAVLFPIRLDKTVMEIEGGWPALIRNTRNIGDFTCWKQYDEYQRALERLLRDLKAEI